MVQWVFCLLYRNFKVMWGNYRYFSTAQKCFTILHHACKQPCRQVQSITQYQSGLANCIKNPVLVLIDIFRLTWMSAYCNLKSYTNLGPIAQAQRLWIINWFCTLMIRLQINYSKVCTTEPRWLKVNGIRYAISLIRSKVMPV